MRSMSTSERNQIPNEPNVFLLLDTIRYNFFSRKISSSDHGLEMRTCFTYTESNVAPNVSFLLSSFVFSYGLVIAIVQLKKIHFLHNFI